MDRIGIKVALENADLVISQMRTLQEGVTSLSRKKATLEIKARVKEAKDAVLDIREQVNKLRLEKISFQFDFHNVQKAIKEIDAETKEGIQAIQKLNKAFRDTHGVDATWDGYYEKLNQVNHELGEMSVKMNEVNTQSQRLRNLDITPRFDAEKLKNQTTTFLTQLGSRVMSLGGALSAITAPIDQFLQGTLYSVAYKGIGKISEGFSRSFSRYDTLSTYPRIMKSLGYSADEADAAVKRLDKSVLGLPTSLDDIVSVQKQFVLASGDMKKATDLAIAANNAFIGGGATEEQRMFGLRQLQDLLSAGKLRTQEWYSLFKSMPAGIKAAGEQLGYTGKKAKDFQRALREGDVSTDDFINAIIKVGLEGGKMYKLAQEMKSTWSAVSANITIAFARMGQHILETLDTVFEAATGKNFLNNIMGLRDYIDGIAEDVQSWVKANPDTIISFFNQIKSIDVAGIAKGMAQAVSQIGGVMLKIINIFGGNGKRLGKMLIYANIFGKALRIVGGAIKGTAGTAGMLVFGGAQLANLASDSKLLKIGVIKKLSNFFKGFKGVANGVEAVEEAGEVAATAAPATASIGTLLTGLLKVVTPAIAIGAYAGAFALVGKAVSSFAKSLKEVSEIKINSWSNLYTNLLNITAIIGALGGIAAALGTATTNPLGAIGALEMAVGGGEILGLTYLAKQIASSMNALATVKVPSEDKLDKIKDALSRIGELYSEIDTGSFWKALSRRLRSGQDNKYLKNIESMTETVSGILQTSQNLVTKIADLSKTKNLTRNINAVRPRLQKLGTFIHDIYVIMQDVVNGDFGTKGVGAGAAYHEERIDIKGATKKFEQMASYIAQIDSVLGGLENIPKHINCIHTKLNKVKNSKSAGGKGKIETDAIAEDIKNIVGIVKAIVDNGKLDELKSLTERLQGINVDAITQPLDKIPTLLGKLQSLRDYFGKNGTKWLTPSGSKTDKQQLKMGGGLDGLMSTSPTYDGKAQSMLESISHIVDFLKQIASKLEQVPDLSEKATTLHTGVTGLYNAYKRFVGFSNYVAKNPVNGDGIKQNISKIVTDTIGALAGAPLMYTYSLAFKAAVANVTKSLKSVTNGKSGSVSAFISGLKKIPAQLQAVSNAMKGKGTYWKNQLVNGFKTAKDDILTAIQNISLALAQGDYTSNFYQAGANAGASYSNGFNNSINLNTPNGTTTTTKTTKKKHKRSFGDRISDWVNNLFASTGGYISKDGVLYRAGGGAVFQPRGTDIIPAMLSEGEYVMQRRATSAFGTKFMQRINNLDLGGAIKALGMRGGQLAYATPTVNIDNSKHVTYNNNQSVNMTNNHASQGYSEARASRYLRKM